MKTNKQILDFKRYLFEIYNVKLNSKTFNKTFYEWIDNISPEGYRNHAEVFAAGLITEQREELVREIKEKNRELVRLVFDYCVNLRDDVIKEIGQTEEDLLNFLTSKK